MCWECGKPSGLIKWWLWTPVYIYTYWGHVTPWMARKDYLEGLMMGFTE